MKSLSLLIILILIPTTYAASLDYYAKNYAYYNILCSLFTSKDACETAGCYWCEPGGCQAEPCTVTTPAGGYIVTTITTTTIAPKPTRVIQVVKWDVLREVAPGKSVVEGIVVKNKLNTTVEGLEIEVKGIPEDWVTVIPSSLDLDPQQSGGFSLGISIPSNASYGDYKVVITFKNAEVKDETFFILRIKELLPRSPLALRIVELNEEAGRTNVFIVVNNPTDESMSAVEVTEEIPKVIASSVEEVQFNVTPTDIIKKDPIILWRMLNLAPQESRNVSYSVNRILSEFTPYIYFPLKEVNLFRAVPTNFSLVAFDIPPAFPGRTSVISFVIQNLDPTSSHRFNFELYIPSGWNITPKRIEEVIGPNTTREYKLLLYLPEDVETGNYILKALFKWDDNLVIKEYVVAVYPPTVFPSLTVIIIVLAVCVVILYIRKIRRRRESRLAIEKLKASIRIF